MLFLDGSYVAWYGRGHMYWRIFVHARLMAGARYAACWRLLTCCLLFTGLAAFRCVLNSRDSARSPNDGACCHYNRLVHLIEKRMRAPRLIEVFANQQLLLCVCVSVTLRSAFLSLLEASQWWLVAGFGFAVYLNAGSEKIRKVRGKA